MAKRRANDVVVAQKAVAKTAPAQVQQDVANSTTVTALRAAIVKLVALVDVR